ncbi:unnamed protein product, partial [Prorocentrum cordatum]
MDEPVEPTVRPEAEVVAVPNEATKAERDAHEALQCPHAARCTECVAGRGLDNKHERVREIDALPVARIDYMFGKTRHDEKAHPVMNAIDNAYDATASIWCEAKGGGDLFVIKSLKRHVIFQRDPANAAARDAAAKVATDLKMNSRSTPKASKGSNGTLERFYSFIEGTPRTWRRAIGRKYGIVIEPRHPIMAWIARHASWTHDRFLVHRSDYKTSFERQHERHCDKKFETARGCGIYLGPSLEDDQRICGARRGITLARPARRLVESERHDKQLLLAMKGIPGDTRPTNASAPVVDRVAEALDLNQPKPTRPPRPEGAAAQEGQGARDEEMRYDDAEDGNALPDTTSKEFTPDSKRAAVEEAKSAAGKRASEAPAEGEAREKERKVQAVKVGNVMVANAMGYPEGTELCAPCELDPNFELLNEAYYDDDNDDGEQLDMDQVREGIEREAKFMESLDIGEVVERPHGKKVWGTRWCHCKKGDGVRSRFVLKQFKDAQAGDFLACALLTEAAPAPMAAATMLEHSIATTDSSVTFTHTPVKEDAEIYAGMTPAYGMGYGFVWKLSKSLYGLREAALREKGIRVVVHTDDPLAPGPTQGVHDEFFDELAKHYAIQGRRVPGEDPVINFGSSLQQFGGVVVEKSKPVYVESIVKAAGTPCCKTAGTAGARPDLAQPGAEQLLKSEEHALCQGCRGTIQFATPRRLDATHPLKEPGRRLSEPRSADMKCLKHLRYLSGTIDLAMVHCSSRDWKRLRGSTDSDWTGCPETQKSTACGIVRWRSAAASAYARTESVLAQSSPEAEYQAAVELAAEMLYVRELVRFMGFETSREIERDASSAIAIASRRGLGKLGHLEVEWRRPQQLVGTGQIKIPKAKGTENRPDVGATFLGKAALEKCRSMLGMTPVGMYGAGTAAALTATGGARYMAAFMAMVNAARAETATTATTTATTTAPEVHVMIAPVGSGFCMLTG